MDALHTEGQHYPRGSSYIAGSSDPLRHCFIVPLLSSAFFSLLIFLCFIFIFCSDLIPSPSSRFSFYLPCFFLVTTEHYYIQQASLDHGEFV